MLCMPEGAFHYARPTGQRPVGLTKGKWNEVRTVDCSAMPSPFSRVLSPAIKADEALLLDEFEDSEVLLDF